MQVVLKERVPKVGQKWDVINVKNGFARNYLFPRLLAVPANSKLIEMAKQKREERVKKLGEMMANAQEMAKSLKGFVIKFSKKANKGKLYGSIAEKDIVEALMDQHKMEIENSMIKMEEHLKTLGEHYIKLHLTEGVDTEIKVIVEEEK